MGDTETSDGDLTGVPALEAWLRMCAANGEFVAQYNRLRGARLRFELPRRSPIEAMADRACGYVPVLQNDPAEVEWFIAHCHDLLMRWPGLDDSRNFVSREVATISPLLN